MNDRWQGNAARNAAVRALIAAHADEFRVLHLNERRRRGLSPVIVDSSGMSSTKSYIDLRRPVEDSKKDHDVEMDRKMNEQ